MHWSRTHGSAATECSAAFLKCASPLHPHALLGWNMVVLKRTTGALLGYSSENAIVRQKTPAHVGPGAALSRGAAGCPATFQTGHGGLPPAASKAPAQPPHPAKPSPFRNASPPPSQTVPSGPKMTARHCMMLSERGEALTPSGGSFWSPAVEGSGLGSFPASPREPSWGCSCNACKARPTLEIAHQAFPRRRRHWSREPGVVVVTSLVVSHCQPRPQPGNTVHAAGRCHSMPLNERGQLLRFTFSVKACTLLLKEVGPRACIFEMTPFRDWAPGGSSQEGVPRREE